jgi:hypothetical protein
MNKYTFEDISNKRFGKLIAIKRINIKDSKGYNRAYWVCQCDCGNIKNIDLSSLKKEKVKSCGCYNKQIHFKHGHTVGGIISKEFESWRAAIDRCNRINNASYSNYGGRGIKVCDRWINSFSNFFEDMGKCPDDCTLDRIDTNGNYEPSNCRWSTPEIQNNNKRNSHFITYKGIKKTVTQWTRELGLGWYQVLKLDGLM